MRTAALVAETFGIDPVLVIEESSTLRTLIRLAAHNIVQGERNKANAKASK